MLTRPQPAAKSRLSPLTLPPKTSRKLNLLVVSSRHPSKFPSGFRSHILNPTIDRLWGLENVQVLTHTSEHDDTIEEERGDSFNGEQWAAQMCQWADLLLLFPCDIDFIARMLQGLTDHDRRLMIIRCWDATKKILLVPGMNNMMWENPITKKQLSKINRKWNWVRVIQPVLWQALEMKLLPWDGEEELVESVRTAMNLKTIGQDLDIAPAAPIRSPILASKQSTPPALPPELWSMILDFTGDWELATAMNIHTSLPTPAEWKQANSEAGPQTPMERLEWAILVGSISDVDEVLREPPAPPRWWPSRLCIKLIMRFGKTSLLSYLETSHKELFWSTFGSTFLPNKASSTFGKLELLDFWRNSPSFLTKEYTEEAIDGASRAGFVHVLEWWRQSGLPLRYTEAALEQASSQGHIDVLEWWKNAADISIESRPNTPAETSKTRQQRQLRLKLKPGKSISYVAQSGSLHVLRWWANSGIPFPHEDTVAKLASAHGHVHILQYWLELRGEKMLYDHQVLASATKMGHADVLEWWNQSGLRVEYKTYDIEEALEDGVEGPRGDAVRRWWAKNGLNLGIATSEWMKTQILGQT